MAWQYAWPGPVSSENHAQARGAVGGQWGRTGMSLQAQATARWSGKVTSPPNMAKTFFTSVGNSADSRGLAQCRATSYCNAQRWQFGISHRPAAPNAAPQPRLAAGARYERTLAGVGCRRWL